MAKPTRHAVSVIIHNSNGQTLFALRSPHKTSYPLVWSLPSHYVAEDETPEDTVARIGRHKLGVKLALVRLVNEGYGDRTDFRLFMHDYEARITEGSPNTASDDYVELKWAEAASFLNSLPVKGECTRLYSEYLAQSKTQ
jgi:ADP-ribose pyrophosphatase YjhB (NUDIX family)